MPIIKKGGEIDYEESFGEVVDRLKESEGEYVVLPVMDEDPEKAGVLLFSRGLDSTAQLVGIMHAHGLIDSKALMQEFEKAYGGSEVGQA